MDDWYIPWIDFLRWEFVRLRAYRPGNEYDWVTYETAPFTPMQNPIEKCCVSFLSDAPFRTRDDQRWEIEIKGEWIEDVSWKEIPKSVALSDLVYLGDWNPDAEADRNLVFPLDRFRELEQEGFIGELAPVVFSFHPTFRKMRLMKEAGPALAEKLIELKVDAFVLFAM